MFKRPKIRSEKKRPLPLQLPLFTLVKVELLPVSENKGVNVCKQLSCLRLKKITGRLLSLAAKERWRKRKAAMEVALNEVYIFYPCFLGKNLPKFTLQTLYLSFQISSFSWLFIYLFACKGWPEYSKGIFNIPEWGMIIRKMTCICTIYTVLCVVMEKRWCFLLTVEMVLRVGNMYLFE